MNNINSALEPLGIFGCLLIGNRAIAINALAMVTHHPGEAEEFEISLINGESVFLSGEDGEAFKKQLSMIAQQVRFGQLNLVKK